MKTLTRRQLGGGLLGAAALGALGRNVARADAPRARRLLVIYAAGGLRSTACFNATDDADRNPWGIAATLPNGAKLGGLFTEDASTFRDSWTLPSWGGEMVPDLASIAPSFAIVGATDHRPDGSPRAGDHGDDSPRMGTGDYGTSPGLLTVINRYLGEAATAPVMDNSTPFGIAPAVWQSAQPTTYVGWAMPSEPPRAGRVDVGRVVEDAIDARYAGARRGMGRATVEVMLGGKRTMRRFGPLLSDPLLRPRSAPDAELGGLTNRMLLEALGATDSLADLDVAVGVRALQMGAPAAAVTIQGFDLHSEERQKAPTTYARYARYLCGIHHLLSQIDDPSGEGKMIDHTLVVTTSEFGRNAHPSGFNSGDGSDHGGDASWRYQAHALFGAGVRPNLLFPTDGANQPREGHCSTQQLLFTLAAAVGVPEGELERVWPSGSPLRPETMPLWDLWA